MGHLRADLTARLKRWAHILESDTNALPVPDKEKKQVDRLVADEHFRRLRKRCHLRELPLAAILPGIERLSVPLGAINAETGHPNHAEMLYVVGAARYLDARRVFEFGTFMGRTTYHFATAIPEAHVWTLDLPRDANPWPFAGHVGSYFENAPERTRITTLRENSESFDTAPFKASMNFIWVDADHSYAGVKNDTRKAFELLAPGGAIMWHDFGPESAGLVEFFVEFTERQSLFHLEKTSILLHIDGVDPLSFTPHPVPFTKSVFKARPNNAPSREGT